MRVDLRRCDRCWGEFDANCVTEPYDIKAPNGRPLDFCLDCTSLLASVINELTVIANQGAGAHLWSTVTKGYVDHGDERVRHELDRGLATAERYTDEVAARPLVIP